MFSGASDVECIVVSSVAEAVSKLEEAASKDRALVLCLMLLSSSEDQDIRVEIGPVLSSLIEERPVFDAVSNVLFKAPLPEIAEIAVAIDLVRQFPLAVSLLEEVFNNQQAIALLRSGWDGLAKDCFNSVSDQREFEKIAIEAGVFRSMALAITAKDSRLINRVKLEAHSLRGLQLIKNYRGILREWLDRLTPQTRVSDSQIERSFERETNYDGDEWTRSSRQKADHHSFQRAITQVDEIKNLIRLAQRDRVRRFASDLINSQLANGDAVYAAKSLCNLAAYSQDLSMNSLALDFTSQAVEISSEDGRAWGQHADALMCLSRYEEALDALKNAERCGEGLFSINSRARIYFYQGDIARALDGYSAALERKIRTTNLFGVHISVRVNV